MQPLAASFAACCSSRIRSSSAAPSWHKSVQAGADRAGWGADTGAGDGRPALHRQHLPPAEPVPADLGPWPLNQILHLCTSILTDSSYCPIDPHFPPAPHPTLLSSCCSHHHSSARWGCAGFRGVAPGATHGLPMLVKPACLPAHRSRPTSHHGQGSARQVDSTCQGPWDPAGTWQGLMREALQPGGQGLSGMCMDVKHWSLPRRVWLPWQPCLPQHGGRPLCTNWKDSALVERTMSIESRTLRGLDEPCRSTAQH